MQSGTHDTDRLPRLRARLSDLRRRADACHQLAHQSLPRGPEWRPLLHRLRVVSQGLHATAQEVPREAHHRAVFPAGLHPRVDPSALLATRADTAQAARRKRLRTAKASAGDAKTGLANTNAGDANTNTGDAETNAGDAETNAGDAETGGGGANGAGLVSASTGAGGVDAGAGGSGGGGEGGNKGGALGRLDSRLDSGAGNSGAVAVGAILEDRRRYDERCAMALRTLRGEMARRREQSAPLIEAGSDGGMLEPIRAPAGKVHPHAETYAAALLDGMGLNPDDD